MFRKTDKEEVPEYHMRALIMTDIHAQGGDFFLPKEEFDCLLLCGDNAETTYGLAHHHKLFQDIRDQFSGPVGFVAGNHDLWCDEGRSSWQLLFHELPKIAKNYCIAYLENNNLEIGDWTIAGTYGHYDYSFGRVAQIIAEKGVCSINSRLITWMDKKRMFWEEKTDANVCHQLLNGFAQRLSKQNREKLISISHTIPHRSLVGHPNSELEAFLNSYSGAERLGKIIEEQGGMAHYCGHTHAKAEMTLGNTKCFNIGNNYGERKYFMFDSEQVEKK